ncbi:zinc finger, CCHC-type containing protein [Tanacetum coccineum]|uniref:Zinc finger, CCHC-type containing protein n=1 Tax=Tanacetum coccineum TaxID=301880 RepID=A0ABQ5E1L5_9ASTR
MASMNTRLNIEKLDGNIVQKHEGSKQVGFKQLGPGVETYSVWATMFSTTKIHIKEQEGSILFGLPVSRQQKFLVLRFFDVKEQQGIDRFISQGKFTKRLNGQQRVKRMASKNTRLNIEKLDGNIVQNHEGSKQVGFKQLGPGVETEVHGVHDEKRVWFEVELHGAQGDHEAEVFQVSNDDTAVAQRWLEDKQPEEKTNTDCLVKEQKKEYQTRWKIKTGNVLNSFNQRSTQQCTKSGVAKHLGVAGLQQQNGLVKETNVTLLAKVCCFLIQSGLSKVLWAEDTTMSIYLVNRSPSSAIGFKTPVDMLGFFGWLAIKQGMLEPVKVKCIFLGYRKGTGSMQVLQGDEFEVEPQDGHTFEVEPHRNVDHVVGSQEYREDSNEAAFAVAAVEKIYAHESLTFNNTVACEVISKWKAGLKDDMDARSDVYVLSNGCKKCSDDSDGYYWESTPGDCDVEKNGKWSCIYAVGSQEYQMVCTRLDIASADVGMLDKFDRGLQTDVQVFVDFDYAMAAYMTLTEAAKEAIWLKRLAIESGFELKIVAGIATGALSKAIPSPRFQHRLNIEKLDGNIVQKHGGSKQVGFKQLGPGVETGVHGVSNDDTVVAQRRLKDKQPEEKTNTDCLVKEQKKEYQTGWKIKTGNVLDSCNQRNMGFNESGEYKKTFIGSRIGTGSMQVLQGVEFEVEPQDDHTFEVEPNGNVAHELIKYREDSKEAAFAVAEAENIYAHESLTFNNTVACEVISKWKVGLKDNMDARSDVYVLSNGCKKCSDDSDVYYWEYTLDLQGSEWKYSEGVTVQVLQREVGTDFVGGTLHTVVGGSLSGDCDVEKNGKWSCIYAVGSHEYQMVCTRLDIASADVDQSQAAYMTLTEAAKEAIWLKRLAIESGFELKIVAGIATGALSKAIPSPRFQHRVRLVEPNGNVGHVAGSHKVQTQDLIYYHFVRDKEQHSAHELLKYREDSNEAAFAVAEAEKIYAHESLTFNNTFACEVISKWKAGLKD